MTDTPKLTIGIPHLDRTSLLKRALESCIRQTVPVHIIVADQGHTQATRDLCAVYDVEHVLTEPGTLWDNWEAAARHCDTPYFAFCQDDDIISPALKREDGTLIPGTGYAHRVLAAFERFPEALHWQARLYCGFCPEDGGIDDVMAAPWGQSFPWVMMPIIKQAPLQWPGQILVPTAYLTSWAMSPAVAFRCGEELNKALSCMPPDAALMAERLILATMGMQGPWIADPMVAGYWIQHSGNESHRQHVDQERQTGVMIEYLDECMDRTDWQDVFGQWCLTMNPMQIVGLANDFQCKASRHAETLLKIMAESLKGRVEAAEPPKHLNGALAHALVDPCGDLLWTQ